MASGKTHDKITFYTIPLVIWLEILIIKDYKLVILNVLIYIFSALMFSGDLDINSIQVNRWGIYNYILLKFFSS